MNSSRQNESASTPKSIFILDFVLRSIVLVGAFSFRPATGTKSVFLVFDSLIALGLTSYLTLAILDWLTEAVRVFVLSQVASIF